MILTLDAIENIFVNETSAAFKNNYSIHQLLEGIFMTYNMMKYREENYWELKYPNKSPEIIAIERQSSFSVDFTNDRFDREVVNISHWYSNTLINFVKCCGAIDFLNKNHLMPETIASDRAMISEMKKHRDSYVKSIPELQTVWNFRNKASAHLAFADPLGDNAATLIESISIIPCYDCNRIKLGALKRQSGEHESSLSQQEWSVTESFESLMPRYFSHHIKP